MGGILLILVVLNSFATGWLLAQVRRMRRTVSAVADAQKGLAKDVRKRRLLDDDSDLDEWE